MVKVAWALVILSRISCGAVVVADEQAQCLHPKARSDEPTVLLQTGAALQTRAAVDTSDALDALPADRAAPADAPTVNPNPPAPVVVYTPGAAPDPVVVRLGQVLTAFGCALVLLTFLAACVDFNRLGLPQSWFPIFAKKHYSREDLQQLKASWPLWLLFVSYMIMQLMMTDQYLPSMGKIEVDLDTTATVMGLSLQVNWFAKGFSAFAMAKFAEYFGRKPMFLLCLVLACVGCASCACAPDAKWFIAGRVLQGIAEGVEPIFAMVARDMISDVDERLNYTGAITSLLILIPTISPVFGGCVASLVGWRIPFSMLAGWGVLNFIAALVLMPETKPPDDGDAQNDRDDEAGPMGSEIGRVFSDVKLLVLLLVEALAMTLILSVDTNFSLILTRDFHEKQLGISWKLAALAAVLIPGGILPASLTRCVGVFNVLRIASIASVVPIIGAGLAGFVFEQSWIALFIWVIVSQIVALAFVICCNTLYFQPVKDLSGAAAAFQTCMTMIIVAAGTGLSNFIVQEREHSVRRLLVWLSATMATIIIVFWTGFGFRPPAWMWCNADLEESQEGGSPKSKKGDKRCLDNCAIPAQCKPSKGGQPLSDVACMGGGSTCFAGFGSNREKWLTPADKDVGYTGFHGAPESAKEKMLG